MNVDDNDENPLPREGHQQKSSSSRLKGKIRGQILQ